MWYNGHLVYTALMTIMCNHWQVYTTVSFASIKCDTLHRVIVSRVSCTCHAILTHHLIVEMFESFSWMCHCPYSLHPSITSSLLFALFYCAVVGLKQSIFSEWESVAPPQNSKWPDIGEPIWSDCVIRRDLLWDGYARFVVRLCDFPPFSGRVFVAEGTAGCAGLSNKAHQSLVQQSTIKA